MELAPHLVLLLDDGLGRRAGLRRAVHHGGAAVPTRLLALHHRAVPHQVAFHHGFCKL
jgi:hypothetical protein